MQSEIDLLKTTEFELSEITAAAKLALNSARKQKKKSDKSVEGSSPSLFSILIDIQFKTKSPLKKRGINHLLLNDLNIRQREFELSDLETRLEAKFLEVEDLENRLRSRLPKGRDPDGQRYVSALAEAASISEQYLSPERINEIQASIPIYNELPYPLIYEGGSNISWILLESANSKSKSGRLQVYFSGISELKFSIQCSRRQLPIFRGFYEDKTENKNRFRREEIPFSEGLNRFRSAQIIWKPDSNFQFRKKRGEITSFPWEVNRLHFHCSVNRVTLSAEGTEQLRQAKLKKLTTKDEKSLIPRKRTELERLRNAEPPPRPSVPIHIRDPNIVIGVCFSPDEPVIVVPIDLEIEAALYALNTKALLNQEKKTIWRNGKKETVSDSGELQLHSNGGKLSSRKPGQWFVQKPYDLVTRLNTLTEQEAKLRKREQSKGKYENSESLSNLSLYVCRLIAARLVELSLKLNVSRVILPDLEGIRDWVQAIISAKAAKAFPDSKKQQKQFLQQFRVKYHRWNYRKLCQEIESCARKSGLQVTYARQPNLHEISEQVSAFSRDEEFYTFKVAAEKMALPQEL